MTWWNRESRNPANQIPEEGPPPGSAARPQDREKVFAVPFVTTRPRSSRQQRKCPSVPVNPGQEAAVLHASARWRLRAPRPSACAAGTNIRRKAGSVAKGLPLRANPRAPASPVNQIPSLDLHQISCLQGAARASSPSPRSSAFALSKKKFLPPTFIPLQSAHTYCISYGLCENLLW